MVVNFSNLAIISNYTVVKLKRLIFEFYANVYNFDVQYSNLLGLNKLKYEIGFKN